MTDESKIQHREAIPPNVLARADRVINEFAVSSYQLVARKRQKR